MKSLNLKRDLTAQRMVREYDPEDQMVIVLNGCGAVVDRYRIGFSGIGGVPLVAAASS